MNNATMIRLLQMFFDGIIMSPYEVQYNTGLPDKDSEEVYEAIKKLRSMPFEEIEAMTNG